MSKCNSYRVESETRYFVDGDGYPVCGTINIPRCWGTKEKDICDCDGDKSKCSFYESVREKAAAEKNNSDIEGVFNEIKNLIGEYWGGDPTYYTNSKNKEEADAAKLCCKILEVIHIAQRENDEKGS